MRRSLKITQEGLVFALAACLFIAFSLTLRGFFAVDNLLSLVQSVSILGILSAGMAFVVIGRGIDLAMVATMVVSVAWALGLTHGGVSLPVALVCGAAFSAFIGLLTGIIVGYAEIPAIFATLAMGSIVYGIGRAFFFQIDVQNTPAGYPWFNFLGHGTVAGVPVPILAFAFIAAALHAILRYTWFGRFLYATGDNPASARVSGIPIRFMAITQYAVTSLIGYVAGVVLAASVSGMNTRIYNSTMIYDVVLVVVLGGISLSGGKGGIRNVLVGTALVAVLVNGMTIMDISYTSQNLIRSFILLSAIVVDTLLNPRDEQTSQQGDI
jgi:ribose transport system permease protein